MKKKINCFSEEEQKFCKKQRINYLAEENINKSSKNLLFEKVRQNEGILERLKGKLQNITINIQNNNLNSDISDSNLIQLSKPNDLLFLKKTETPFERRKKTENKIDNLFCIGNEKKIDVKAKNSLNIPQKTANKPEDFYEEIIKFEVTPEKQTEKPTFPQKETLRKHSKTNWASETIKKSNQYKENSSFHENNQKKKIIGKESIVSKSSKIIKDNLQKKPSNQLKKSSWEWQKDRRNHICKVLLEIDQKYTFLKKHIG